MTPESSFLLLLGSWFLRPPDRSLDLFALKMFRTGEDLCCESGMGLSMSIINTGVNTHHEIIKK